METAQAEGGISDSGQRRRNRKRKMKRLGFEQVTLYVPRGEVRALKRDMAMKEKVAIAKKALAEYEKATAQQAEGADTYENKAEVDVLAGAKPSAPAATMTSTPQGTGNTPHTAPQAQHGAPVPRTPMEPHSAPLSAPQPHARPPITGGSDLFPSPGPAKTEAEMDAMLAAANGVGFPPRY